MDNLPEVIPGFVFWKELAKAANVHENTLRNWEDNGRVPYPKHVGPSHMKVYPTETASQIVAWRVWVNKPKSRAENYPGVMCPKLAETNFLVFLSHLQDGKIR